MPELTCCCHWLPALAESAECQHPAAGALLPCLQCQLSNWPLLLVLHQHLLQSQLDCQVATAGFAFGVMA
jgi:hypothetical protein